MNPLTVLQDSLYFSRRHLLSILQLCLPVLLVEALFKQVLGGLLSAPLSPTYDLLMELLFYPLYTCALILFLDARTRGETPARKDLWAASLRLWPTFAVLAACCTLLIMAGVSLFVLPGIWVAVKLAFSGYLLVLRGATPLAAMRASFFMSRGQMWPVLLCMLCVYVPLWVLEAAVFYALPENAGPVVELVMDTLAGCLELFTTVVLFRLFMLLEGPTPRAGSN